MPDFQVKITTPVELEGAKQLADQLERDIGKTKALGQSTVELEEKLKAVKAAIANAGEGSKESAEGIDRESQAMENRIALYRATVEAQNEVFQAQTRATEAQIDAAEAMHAISGQEALRQRQAAQNAATQSGFEAQNAAAQNEIEEKMRRQAEAHHRLSDAINAHDDAVEATAGNHEAIERQENELELRKKNREELQKAAATAQAGQLNPITVASGRFAHAIGGFTAQEQAEFFSQQARQAEADVVQASQHLEQLRNKQLVLDANTEQAKKKADIEQNVVNTYTQQIRQAHSLLAINKQKQKDELEAQQKLFHAQQEMKTAEQVNQARSLFGASSFEKMGASFGGVGSPTLLVDHAARTAQNTTQMTLSLAQIVQMLNRNPNNAVARAAWANQNP